MNKVVEFIILAQILTLHTFIPFCVFVLYYFAQIIGFPIYCIVQHYMSCIVYRKNRRRERKKEEKIFKRIEYCIDNNNIEEIEKIYINEDDTSLRWRMIRHCPGLATQENYNKEDYWFARKEMIELNSSLATQENYDKEVKRLSDDIRDNWKLYEIKYAMLYANKFLSTQENYDKDK